jgi:hypothetical protein
MPNLNIRYLAEIKQRDPQLGQALEDMVNAVGTMAEQVNSNPQGSVQAPPRVSAFNVTAVGGIFDFQIQDNAPITRGLFYHIEGSLTASFTMPILIYTGPSRNFRTSLGNQTYYFRAFSQYLTSEPSPAVYYGSAATPTPVVGGGATTGPVPQASAGSGTGRTNGQDGGIGFGKNPLRGITQNSTP